ncbi:unnamed protein product [Owenia fusiformis]|uniref:Uncharacterized protein n=1 Tax=Owenia fusiformis TaxID=6347 RepID=A0A8J1TBM9_OWEFU|nr:unnamed protein product [Owenia fusiformis]
MKIILEVLSMVFLVFHGTIAQPFTPDEIDRIDNFMLEAMDCFGYTGLMVSMVRGGQTVFARGYGKAEDYGEDLLDIDATPQTIFPIASCSKHFTGTILGHVIENTNYTWDTPIYNILKDYGEDVHFNDIHRTREMTLRDMLAHRHGIPGHDIILAADTFSREEMVQRIRFFRPTSPIRNNWDYNNILYGLAAYVGEKITGKTWDDLLKEEFWDKLGMTSTSTLLLGNRTNYEGFARAHVNLLGDTILGPLDMGTFSGVARGAAGAGGVAISAEDMGKWMNFQMGANDFDDIINPLIFDDVRGSSSLTRRFIGPGSVVPRREFYSGSDRYSLGFHSGWWRGHPSFTHSGSLVMYTSHMGLLPYANIGVASAINNPGSGMSQIRQFGYDMLLGLEPVMNITRACGDMRRQALEDEQEEDDYEDYGLKMGLQTVIKSLGNLNLQKMQKKIKEKSKLGVPLTSDGDLNKLFEAIGNMKPGAKKIARSKKHRVRRQGERPLEDYTGTFGNFAYGNVTIALYPDDPDDAFDGDLLLIYSWIELTLDRSEENPDHFDLSLLGLIEPFEFPVSFSARGPSGAIDTAEIPLDPRDGPYTYTRDLKFADAPPPDSVECPTPAPCGPGN